jgi:hypothetical protein
MGKRSISLAVAVAFLWIGVAAPAHAQVTNLAWNPSFEEADDVIRNDTGWTKWATWNDAQGAATVTRIDTTEFIDGTQSYRIEPKGNTNWYFIVVNMVIPLTTGKPYTVSFWAKAEAARPLTVQWKSEDNNTTWATTDFQLTNEWAEYTFTAQAQNARGKVEFLCAATEVPFWLDFLWVYEGSYVAGIMPSEKASSGKATRPAPDAGAVDVPREVILAWKPGPFAATHDVYLGTTFSDVNAADRSNPMGVLAAQGQDANTFEPPSRLEFGRTYYWRVDEVNAAPSSFIHRGDVWNFTVEPFAYAIGNVTAKASSAAATAPAQNTVNGSGLDAGDLHSTDTAAMWLTANNLSRPIWIQYDFDRTYALSELWVWNYNTVFEDILGIGVKDVTIEYSADGTNWQMLGDFQFAQGTGAPGYAHNTTVSFGGVAAQSVRITIQNAWVSTTKFGLSEVRFFYVPTFAREPKPATGATGVAPDVTLTWRAGREAASHDVYIGTDPNTLMPAGTAATSSYAPADLSLATTYYWRVDEVNTAEAAGIWPSAVWSFTTSSYIVIDDMESYNDVEPTRVYDTWIDGYGTSTNGSLVGNDLAPFAEQTIVHGGKQSMPLRYSNAGAITTSEATRMLEAGQGDWTRNGVQTLTLYFRGETTNTTTVPLWVKLTDQSNRTGQVTFGSAAGEDVLVLADSAWTEWNIPLSRFSGVTLSNIKSITIGLGPGNGSGKLYFDDIVLYPARETTVAEPVLVGWWKLDNDAQDASGYGNHGTLRGTPTWAAGGKIGAALNLNGRSDYVDCGNGASLNITDQVTLSAWVKPNMFGDSAYQGIVGKGDHAYVLQQTNVNAIQLAIYDGTWYSANSTGGTTALNSLWHHVAGTYDGVQLRLYIDGKMAASTLRTGVIAPTTYAVYIGANSEQSGRLFSGTIDDVRIYRGVLPTSEIVKLANP